MPIVGQTPGDPWESFDSTTSRVYIQPTTSSAVSYNNYTVLNSERQQSEERENSPSYAYERYYQRCLRELQSNVASPPPEPVFYQQMPLDNPVDDPSDLYIRPVVENSTFYAPPRPRGSSNSARRPIRVEEVYEEVFNLGYFELRNKKVHNISLLFSKEKEISKR